MAPWFAYPPLAALGSVDRRGDAAEFDVILISGDAYVDHPSFPAGVVVRLLQSLGLKVAVIAQPDWRSTVDFEVFGRPRLFFAVAAGAMDSMVANFTSMKKPRSTDRLSPGGQAGLRPKRAASVYAQRLREAFPDVPVILGGIEASLRRFSHFDFWENRVRDSILTDSGAFMVVYGMAEAPLTRVVRWFQERSGGTIPTMGCMPPKSHGWRMCSGAIPTMGCMPPKSHGWRMCSGAFVDWPLLPQTCIRVGKGMGPEVAGRNHVILPTAEECRTRPAALLTLSSVLDTANRPDGPVLVQQHPKGDIVCFPPSASDAGQECAIASSLRFNRRAHPLYKQPIPALVPVQFSVISHRGCAGTCTFCSLAVHQGRNVRSRTPDAILAEVSTFPGHPDFRGTIPDIGGPSVNMFGWQCRAGGCSQPVCTWPVRCRNLQVSLKPLRELLEKAAAVKGVKHVFIGSGLRFDLLRHEDWGDFQAIVRNHVSGQLKIAPEHADQRVLSLMRKGSSDAAVKFIRDFIREFGGGSSPRFLVPYFMTAFPGSGNRDTTIRSMIDQYRLVHEQIQEFTPTPGTLATAMFYAGVDLAGKPLEVLKNDIDRKRGRRDVQGT